MNHVESRLAEVTENFEYRARLILEGRDPDKQERFQKRIEELDRCEDEKIIYTHVSEGMTFHLL